VTSPEDLEDLRERDLDDAPHVRPPGPVRQRATPLSVLALSREAIAVQLPERVVLLEPDSRRVIWEHALQSASLLLPGLVAHPSSALIGAGSMQEVHWIDRESGSLVQQQRGQIMRGMAIDTKGDQLVVTQSLRAPLCRRPPLADHHEEIPVGNALWEAAAFTRDAQHLILSRRPVTGSPEDTILVLNAETFELERSFAFGDWITRLRVAAGDHVLVLGGARGVTAWDLGTGHALWSCPTAGFAFDVTPDGNHVVTLDRGEWVAFDALTGQETRWPGRTTQDRAWSVSVARDGTAVSFLDDRLIITTIPLLAG
jgi:hypothetical protein